MANDEAIVALLRFADGDESPAIVAWLRAGFRAWLWHAARGAPPSLLHCLDLPSTDKKLRLAMRDHWLMIAAHTIEGPTRAARVQLLAAACVRFERRVWPLWRARPVPPGHASDLDQALFYARRQGLALPESTRRLWDLVAANRGERCKPLHGSSEASLSMTQTDETLDLHA